tara:strand:+ start:3898 stop:4338 length:441 start_codon:yes stop_codon:yes gene_type:complete
MKEQILSDMKTAMKAKDADRLTTLRMLQSAVKNKEIELRPNEITDKEVMEVVKKLIKQRQDSAEQYEKAGREDLLAKEKSEIEILEVYLPEQMSEEQVGKIVDDMIAELGASSMKEMGAVVKAVMAKTAGAADNKIISSLVKAKLS